MAARLLAALVLASWVTESPADQAELTSKRFGELAQANNERLDREKVHLDNALHDVRKEHEAWTTEARVAERAGLAARLVLGGVVTHQVASHVEEILPGRFREILPGRFRKASRGSDPAPAAPAQLVGKSGQSKTGAISDEAMAKFVVILFLLWLTCKKLLARLARACLERVAGGEKEKSRDLVFVPNKNAADLQAALTEQNGWPELQQDEGTLLGISEPPLPKLFGESSGPMGKLAAETIRQCERPPVRQSSKEIDGRQVSSSGLGQRMMTPREMPRVSSSGTGMAGRGWYSEYSEADAHH